MTLSLIAAAVRFVLTLLIGRFLIPELRKLKAGQEIREDGPTWHKSKAGTPTMGGIMFILGAGVTVFILGWSFMLEGVFWHLYVYLFALIFGDPGGSGTLSIAGWTMTTTAMGVMGLLTVLIPLLLLIYILFCLIASRKPSGRATLIVFLLWILTIVATGGLILREYGGEQRHRLHELFDEARDELRDREIDRMPESVGADTVPVVATEPAPQTAPASDSAHRITIKGPKKQKVDIRVTEHSVNIDFDDESYE